MGSVLNGLVALEINDGRDNDGDESDESDDADFIQTVLFEAVASSSSLERFVIFAPGKILALDIDLCRALKRNRRLRFLSLTVRWITTPQEILRAVLWETELEELSLLPAQEEHVSLSTLIEGLCREDCTLRRLAIKCHFNIDVDWRVLSIYNTSLVEMDLTFCNLTCYQAVKIANTCRSLQILRIDPISDDLVPLDEIILGENAILRRLHILDTSSIISEEKWIEFCGKIPKMKSLKQLEINFEPFLEYRESLETALLDALWKNTSLERLEISKVPHHNHVYEGAFPKKVSIPLCLNRAGMKLLRNAPSEQPMPKGLWPLVLERAMRLKYYSIDDTCTEGPSLNSTRTDAVYWLLREHSDMLVV